MPFSHKKISAEQCKDSGLALLLICLICYQAWRQPAYVSAAILILLLVMTCPRIFLPFARFWFALSNMLGSVASRIVLTLFYLVLVLPVGLVRRFIGKDSMQLKCWKQGHGSVFRERNHRFVADDLERPY
jgi:Saxitoxin biosynthesis operon protein SxtJ